jgi:hypothetical protein
VKPARPGDAGYRRPNLDTPPATTDEDLVDQDDGGVTAAARSRAVTAPRSLSVPATVDSGAGFVLGLLVWGWVVLPFLAGGPAAVRNTLRAKFFNKAPDGSWLP